MLSVEHLIPRTSFGQRTSENETVACRPCNCARGNQQLASWAAQCLAEGRPVALDWLIDGLQRYLNFWAPLDGKDHPAVRYARRQQARLTRLRHQSDAARYGTVVGAITQMAKASGKTMRTKTPEFRSSYRAAMLTALQRISEKPPEQWRIVLTRYTDELQAAGDPSGPQVFAARRLARLINRTGRV
jgi:hypothetical protein